MNNSKTEIDNWFIEGTLTTDKPAVPEVWEAVFDADRHLVHLKLGPYWKLFLRPEGFVKRFYHQVYRLPVESWHISDQVKLYDGFCTFDIRLEIRFQATLKYARQNLQLLSHLNAHIKTTYQDLLLNLIQKELLDLSNAAWIQKGVTELEKKIAFAVSEMLIIQNIQSQTLCTLKPSFADFPDLQIAQESVFLCVLKRSFEFKHAKREELFHQKQEFEKQNQQHRQKVLEHISRDIELNRLKQTQEAFNQKCLLEDKEQQQQTQFEIEQRLHLNALKHENDLKNIGLEQNLHEQKKRESRLQQAEQEKQQELLAHQSKLKEKELAAEIAQYEYQQSKWQAARDKVYAQQKQSEQRQQQQEFEAELKNQKQREQRRMEMKKEIYEKTKDFDVYLRREIELLELEKQRLDLQLQINAIKNQSDNNPKS